MSFIWTHFRPQANGWFFRKYPLCGGYEVEVIQIENGRAVDFMPDGFPDSLSLEDEVFEGNEWAGPIPLPEPNWKKLITDAFQSTQNQGPHGDEVAWSQLQELDDKVRKTYPVK